jgi:hypothetical protein
MAVKTTKKAAPRAEATTRKQHRWTEDQLAYLVANASVSRKLLVEGFREEFGIKASDLSDTAIAGRRFGILERPNTSRPELRVAGLTARLEALNAEVAHVKAALADAKKALAAAKRAQAK